MTQETSGSPDIPEEITEIRSSRLSEEDRYYYEQSYKEPVESITRIEEMAKFLTGATATISGLYLSALKLSVGEHAVPRMAWHIPIPFIFWILSIITLVLVLFPQPYATGRDEPESWKKAFTQARKRKFRYLFAGTLLFVAGMISAIYPFVGQCP